MTTAAAEEEGAAQRNEARKITIMLNYVLGAARVHGLLGLRGRWVPGRRQNHYQSAGSASAIAQWKKS